MTITQEIQAEACLPSAEEIEFRWRAAVRDRLASVDLKALGPIQGAGSIEERDLGDLLITDWVCPPVEGILGGRSMRHEEDALLLFTASSGEQVVESAEDTAILRPGSLLLLSTRTKGRFLIPEQLAKRTVRVPLTALSGFDTGGVSPGCLLIDTARRPLANLLANFINDIDRHIGGMSPAEVEGARTAMLVLIAGLIRASRADVGDHDILPQFRRQLEHWIVANIANGAIRVADLAAAHNVAPRTIHRAFASTGDTFGSIVRSRRLAAARNDLVNTNSSIAAIAHRWGFSDASHFGREFRREFSLPPGEYRETHGLIS